MQTFLPYADFAKSASVLDRQRLGKQRVECKQIMLALEGKSRGWTNHPATRMWRGYEVALAHYAIAVCNEWRNRRYKDELIYFFMARSRGTLVLPHWLGDEKFHSSHRSNLLRKDPIHYSQFKWNDDPATEYVWPV